MTKLDTLLQKTENYVRDFQAKCDHCLNTFTPSIRLKIFHDFKGVMGSYNSHFYKSCLGINPPESIEYSWREIYSVLLNVYGRMNGEKVAFHMAITGENGGLNAVLNAVTSSLFESWAKNGINSAVCQYWCSLSSEEQLVADREYLEKYSHLLPSEFVEANGIRTTLNFTQVLNQHPWVILKARTAVGSM